MKPNQCGAETNSRSIAALMHPSAVAFYCTSSFQGGRSCNERTEREREMKEGLFRSYCVIAATVLEANMFNSGQLDVLQSAEDSREQRKKNLSNVQNVQISEN